MGELGYLKNYLVLWPVKGRPVIYFTNFVDFILKNVYLKYNPISFASSKNFEQNLINLSWVVKRNWNFKLINSVCLNRSYFEIVLLNLMELVKKSVYLFLIIKQNLIIRL